MLAAFEGHAKVVRLLLEAGASPEARDEDGMQAIHFAAKAACRDGCATLLAARADPAAKDDLGRDAFACLPRDCLEGPAGQEGWAELLRGAAGGAKKAPRVGANLFGKIL